MKLYNLYIGAGLTLLAGAMGSCKSDYLDEPPITNISDAQLGESLEAARGALYGTCQAMYFGLYQDNNDRNNSGEGWFQTYYGDAGSPDFWDTFLWGYQSDMQNWSLMLQNTWYASQNGWMYGYNLVAQANSILAKIDLIPVENEDEEAQRDFIKAEALTIRAHGYIRMMQVYGPRWEDSNNGQEWCLILRDQPGTQPMPLSTYNDCISFIKNDLDNAIALYQSSNMQRSYGFEPDINVARGIYSRIALLNHDWQLASEMASAARADYPIMSPEEYRQGFVEPNGEWLWWNDKDMTYVGYNSWGATYSCNGAYATAYNWAGAGCISFRLYDEIYSRHSDDVRCEFFWTPDKANKYVDLGIKAEDFWNPEMVNSEYFYMYGGDANELMSAAISLFSRHMNPDPSVYTVSAFGADISLSDENAGKPLARRTWFRGLADAISACQPGAQLKFWSIPSELGASCHPFLRASELLLTQAEAEFELGNETTARNLLIELNKKRIPNYTCDLSGQALRDEIRLYRRMELWGEGDCWFSFKRWNLGVERNPWVANDPSSDTFPPSYEGSWDPTYGNNWRYRIPTTETNYNPLVADQLNN